MSLPFLTRLARLSAIKAAADILDMEFASGNALPSEADESAAQTPPMPPPRPPKIINPQPPTTDQQPAMPPPTLRPAQLPQPKQANFPGQGYGYGGGPMPFGMANTGMIPGAMQQGGYYHNLPPQLMQAIGRGYSGINHPAALASIYPGNGSLMGAHGYYGASPGYGYGGGYAPGMVPGPGMGLGPMGNAYLQQTPEMVQQRAQMLQQYALAQGLPPQAMAQAMNEINRTANLQQNQMGNNYSHYGPPQYPPPGGWPQGGGGYYNPFAASGAYAPSPSQQGQQGSPTAPNMGPGVGQATSVANPMAAEMRLRQELDAINRQIDEAKEKGMDWQVEGRSGRVYNPQEFLAAQRQLRDLAANTTRASANRLGLPESLMSEATKAERARQQQNYLDPLTGEELNFGYTWGMPTAEGRGNVPSWHAYMDARNDLAAAKERAIQLLKSKGAEPPLTAEQRARLAQLPPEHGEHKQIIDEAWQKANLAKMVMPVPQDLVKKREMLQKRLETAGPRAEGFEQQLYPVQQPSPTGFVQPPPPPHAATPAPPQPQPPPPPVPPVPVEKATAKGASIKQADWKSQLASALMHILAAPAGGAAIGATAGALSAPSDYTLDAALHGGRIGARTGLHVGLGAGAGRLAGYGLGRGSSVLPKGGVRAPIMPGVGVTLGPGSEGTLGNLGAAAGGGAGLLAALPKLLQMGPTPWERGDIPLMQQLDSSMRRRVPLNSGPSSASNPFFTQPVKMSATGHEMATDAALPVAGMAGGAGMGALLEKIRSMIAPNAGKPPLYGRSAVGGALGGAVTGMTATIARLLNRAERDRTP